MPRFNGTTFPHSIVIFKNRHSSEVVPDSCVGYVPLNQLIRFRKY